MNNQYKTSENSSWRDRAYRSCSAFLGFIEGEAPPPPEEVWQRLLNATDKNVWGAASTMLRIGYIESPTVNQKAIRVVLSDNIPVDIRLNAISILSSRMKQQLDLDAIQELADISENQAITLTVREAAGEVLRSVCADIQWIRMRRVMLASQMFLDGRDRAYAHEFFSTQNGIGIGEIEGILRDSGWSTEGVMKGVRSH